MDRVKDYTLVPFASENLVVLHLGSTFELDISGLFSFPSMKVINLDSVEFPGVFFNLFSICPALEELIILEYADYWAGNGNAFSDYEIVVDVPKHEVLKYKDYVASGFSFKNCHSLVRAAIVMVLSYFLFKYGAIIELHPINTMNTKVFSAVSTYDLHVFRNLTRLRLGCNEYEYCGLLLPAKPPNFEELILGKENVKMNSRVLEKFTREPPPPRQRVPECLSQHHLKTV
ncbi:hypothetical protein V6N13_087944 [Hibiscus sabdariffa]|uniref:Uncharacterized protein n=2 Tax=Hibiscus sabdariffa TaxID=183260 RepID=A0ABR1ZDE1_9ROSI